MNEENLIQNQNRSPSELRENGRKGGKASGVARSFRAAFKKRMRDNPELIDALLDALLIAVGAGNIHAIKLAIELSGEGTDDLDKKLKKAQIEKIKAETDLLRRKTADGGTGDGDAAAALALALDNSAEAVWKENDHYNDNADKTGGI